MKLYEQILTESYNPSEMEEISEGIRYLVTRAVDKAKRGAQKIKNAGKWAKENTIGYTGRERFNVFRGTDRGRSRRIRTHQFDELGKRSVELQNQLKNMPNSSSVSLKDLSPKERRKIILRRADDEAILKARRQDVQNDLINVQKQMAELEKNHAAAAPYKDLYSFKGTRAVPYTFNTAGRVQKYNLQNNPRFVRTIGGEGKLAKSPPPPEVTPSASAATSTPSVSVERPRIPRRKPNFRHRTQPLQQPPTSSASTTITSPAAKPKPKLLNGGKRDADAKAAEAAAIRSMALRNTASGGSTPAPFNHPSKRMGSQSKKSQPIKSSYQAALARLAATNSN